MRLFTAEDKMTSVIRSNYEILPVLNRFGIRLGIGDVTIAEVCDEKKININFFLLIINTFNNEEYFTVEIPHSVSPDLVIGYLRKTHLYYLNYIVPRLEQVLEKMVSGAPSGSPDLKVIDSFYKKYKKELLLHIGDEEENTFPYVLGLLSGSVKPGEGYNIKVFEREHSDLDTKLRDLRNLIIKYLRPEYDDNDCNEFLISLFRFEKDLKDHARIEDKILVPMVHKIEKKLSGK
jgi:regulator of cell morphogenesis and NO signaling